MLTSAYKEIAHIPNIKYTIANSLFMFNIVIINISFDRMNDMADIRIPQDPFSFVMREERVVERALSSWSRISSAGQTVLIEALQIFNPVSKDIADTEELVSFLQGLKEEGHKPTVLRSMDVYGYKSSTTRPLPADMHKSLEKNQRLSKKKGRKPLNKKRDIKHTSSSVVERVGSRHFSQERFKDAVTTRPPFLTVEASQVQHCLRLTNIKGLPAGHTARLQIHTDWNSVGMSADDSKHPPTRTGIPLQPSQGAGRMPTAVALLSPRMVSCPVRVDSTLIGDSAPIMFANMCDMDMTSNELGWRDDGAQRGLNCSKERRMSEPMWLMNRRRDSECRLDENSLRWKVIKVDNTLSVEETRRNAQMILQVDLSPVIKIQPLVLGYQVDYR